jgi:hypothetical protein
MTSIARQRISKQAFSTTEKLRFPRGPCREVIKEQRRPSYLLSRIGSSSGQSEVNENGKKKELGCEK